MGLDFSKRVCIGLENKPHWSYGSFMRFRFRVAKSLGIDIREMKGFEGLNPMGNGVAGKEWPGKTPIEEFLWHSDCDGNISPESCEKIAPILEGIIGGWGEDRENSNNYDTVMGLTLVAAMRECAKEEADLVFT
jgi:hypothetical protein